MLADKLKTATLNNHQQLEKALVTRMKAIRSTHDYVQLLQLFYTYFGGLEEKIKSYITADVLADYDDRRKSAALAQDIQDLGGMPGAKASGSALPPITNTQQALGALYVIEGSTLGGKIISKMMAQQLGIANGRGLGFFNGYGDDTDAMWSSFKEVLNQPGRTEAETDEIVDAANNTFLKFKNWAQ